MSFGREQILSKMQTRVSAICRHRHRWLFFATGRYPDILLALSLIALTATRFLSSPDLKEDPSLLSLAGSTSTLCAAKLSFDIVASG